MRKKIPMNVTRCALILHLQNPPIRYHLFHHAPTFLRNSTTSPSLFKARSFSQSQIRAFGSALASSPPPEDSKGRDTFFAEENVLWSSLGLSDTISRALSNIALKRPSLVQVLFFFFFPLFPFANSCPLCCFKGN